MFHFFCKNFFWHMHQHWSQSWSQCHHEHKHHHSTTSNIRISITGNTFECVCCWCQYDVDWQWKQLYSKLTQVNFGIKIVIGYSSCMQKCYISYLDFRTVFIHLKQFKAHWKYCGCIISSSSDTKISLMQWNASGQ